MRISKKNQAGGESKDGKRWMIAGIGLRAPVKSVCTKYSNDDGEDDDVSSESGSTTPTSSQLRVAECPPAPRKRRPVSSCYNNNNGNGKGNREFYTSPDIDSFFKVVLNSGRAKC